MSSKIQIDIIFSNLQEFDDELFGSGDFRFSDEVSSRSLSTLVCRIDMQGKVNVQVGKFLKNIKRADPNKAEQGGFFSQN